jgi:hypothetical protein
MKGIGPKAFMTLILFVSPREIRMPAVSTQNAYPRFASFVGQVMDSKCATTGSHETTMKRLGAKDSRECTMKCAKDGSFVLYDPETKTVYQLNDQEKPVRFAGEKVKVSGQYDEWSETIEIESIELTP